MWSKDGLSEAPSSDGSFVCATTHLTVFAAMLELIASSALCSSARVWTAEGLEALGDHSDWLYKPATLFFWALLLTSGLMLTRAILRDMTLRRLGQTGDELLLAKRDIAC